MINSTANNLIDEAIDDVNKIVNVAMGKDIASGTKDNMKNSMRAA